MWNYDVILDETKPSKQEDQVLLLAIAEYDARVLICLLASALTGASLLKTQMPRSQDQRKMNETGTVLIAGMTLPVTLKLTWIVHVIDTSILLF